MRRRKRLPAPKTTSDLDRFEEDTASAQMMFKTLLERADPDSLLPDSDTANAPAPDPPEEKPKKPSKRSGK